MTQLALAFLTYISSFLRSRHDLGLEILALRQQLAVFNRKNPRHRINRFDRLLWVTLSSIWDRWTEALIMVKPETVVGWRHCRESAAYIIDTSGKLQPEAAIKAKTNDNCTQFFLSRDDAPNNIEVFVLRRLLSERLGIHFK